MKTKPESSLINLQEVEKVFFGILKNWYIVLISIVISVSLAYLYIHKEQDLFESKMQILLKSDETYDYQNALYKGLGASTTAFATYEKIASQMRVITSSSILNTVLDELNLDVSYFIRGRLKTTEVFEHLPFKVVSNNFSANKTRDFNLRINSLEGYTLTYYQNDNLISSEYKFGELVADNGLFFSVTPNSNLTINTLPTLQKIDYEFIINSRQHLLKKYQKAIEVTNIEYTSIIELSIKDNIRERSKIILDSLGSVYTEYSRTNKRDINENTLGYINKQIDEVLAIIESIGSELEAYKQSQSILNLTREEESYFQQMVEVESAIKNFELQQTSARNLTAYVSGMEGNDVALPPSLYLLENDEYLIKLVNSLYQLRLDRSSSIVNLGENNIKVVEISKEIDLMRKELLKYLVEFDMAVSNRLTEMRGEFNVLQTKIQHIPKTHREMLNIERKLQVNEELYSFLLSRRAETIIAKAGIIPEVKVIERPTVTGIIYPDRPKFMGQWTLIGLVIGLAAAFLKLYTLEKIETIDDLTTVTDISVLGIIPTMSKDVSYLYKEVNSRSRLYEAFRSLRANLQFMGLSSEKNVILVTSLHPGEGKTFTSVNISYVLSRTKKKVLLVDCDLHKPRIRSVFEQPNSKGLSNYLGGGEPIDGLITHFDDHFDILFSGPIPPNASELVASDDFRLLIKKLRSEYDFIVIDTPPIGLITDALVMMDLADVKLFIMNSKFTTRRIVRYLNEIVRGSNIENGAIILNNAKKPFTRYYSGSYRYYYGYGYGYGYGDGYGYGSGAEEPTKSDNSSS